MKNSVIKLLSLTKKFSEFFLGLVLLVMVFIVFSNVLSRYFLNISISWSEEISRFMLVWLVFLGAALAYEKDEHLSLDILMRYLPKKAALFVKVIADFLVLFSIGLITKGGYSLTVNSWDWLSPATMTPYAYVYIVVPICSVALLLQTIYKLICHIKQIISKEEMSCY